MTSPTISTSETSVQFRQYDHCAKTLSPPEPNPRMNIDAVSEDVADLTLNHSHDHGKRESASRPKSYDEPLWEDDGWYCPRSGDPSKYIAINAFTSIDTSSNSAESTHYSVNHAVNFFKPEKKARNGMESQVTAARGMANRRAERELTESSLEMHRANELISRLASELQGQQTELQIMTHKMQLNRKLMLELLGGITTMFKNDPKSLKVELQEWRTAIAEWDWIACVNDRAHEVGSLLDIVNARNGR